MGSGASRQLSVAEQDAAELEALRLPSSPLSPTVAWSPSKPRRGVWGPTATAVSTWGADSNPLSALDLLNKTLTTAPRDKEGYTAVLNERFQKSRNSRQFPASVDSLFPESRSDRPRWVALAAAINEAAKTEVPSSWDEELERRVMSGSVELCVQQPLDPGAVRMYFSSSDDLEVEAAAIAKDVFPFLRRICGVLGLSFITVDVRHGVEPELPPNETVSDELADACNAAILQQMRWCRDSVGPVSVLLLGSNPSPKSLPQLKSEMHEGALRTLDRPSNAFCFFFDKVEDGHVDEFTSAKTQVLPLWFRRHSAHLPAHRTR